MGRRRKIQAKAGKIEVVKDLDKPPVPIKVFEQAIIDIADGYKKITNSGVKRDTIAALIKDKTGISKTVIHRVLDSVDSLRKDWLTV